MMDSLVPRDSGAVISDCGHYRYRLYRRVTASDRIALFVMLNPSTADAEQDDPTIRRCKGFARAMDCGRLVVVNLFAFRTKSPKLLMQAMQPIGPDNDRHINQCAQDAVMSGGRIVCAWGANGDYLGRDGVVLRRLLQAGCDPMSLGETAKGMPRHPLYLPHRCAPLPYRKP
jgi:hypothetical protein